MVAESLANCLDRVVVISSKLLLECRNGCSCSVSVMLMVVTGVAGMLNCTFSTHHISSIIGVVAAH